MLKRLLYSLLALALSLAAFTRYRPTTAENVRGEVETTCNLRSHDEPYWGEAFCLEMMLPGTESTYIHLDHGYRYTAPVNKPVIYMLGNSTMWGSYVLDQDTIPSRLQQIVGDAYRVVNRGEPSYTIAAEMADLQTIRLRPGDVVVMYDGIADIDSCTVQKDHSTQYKHYLDLAQAYTTASGAAWFHFLQPTLYSRALTPNEQAMMDKFERETGCAQGQVIAAEYPQLQKVNVGYDFTHILDSVRVEGAVLYVDWGHLDAQGNEFIAQAIYQVISTF